MSETTYESPKWLQHNRAVTRGILCTCGCGADFRPAEAPATSWVVLSLDTYTRPANAAVRAEVVNDIAIAVRGVMQVHRPTIRPIITPDVHSDIVIHRYEASLLIEGDKDAIRDHITELLAREGVIRADDDVAQF